MTIREMHYTFSLLCEGVDQLKSVSFIDRQKDEFLNLATRDIVVAKADQSEINQRIDDELRPLIVRSSAIPYTSTDNTRFVFDLPSDYLRMWRVEGNVDGCVYKGLTSVQHDDMNYWLTNYNTKPDALWGNIPYVNEAGSIAVYTDGNFTVDDVIITYLRYPAEVRVDTYTLLDGSNAVVTNSDLPEELHPQIVRKAVQIASASVINPNNYQLAAQEFNVNNG